MNAIKPIHNNSNNITIVNGIIFTVRLTKSAIVIALTMFGGSGSKSEHTKKRVPNSITQQQQQQRAEASEMEVMSGGKEEAGK